MKTRSPLPPWITWLTGFFFLVTHAVSQAVVQRNTITTGNNPVGYDKGYIVLDGAYLAFQDMNTVPLYQNIRVNKGGALYYINNNLEGFNINSAHAFFVDFVFQNDGTVVVDDRKSASAGHFKIYDGSFTNTGSIMFASSQGDTFDISGTSVTNTGLIYSLGTDSLKPQQLKIGNNVKTWYNTGTICLTNTSFDLVNPIQGVGCVSIGAHSLFNIHDINVQQQTVYLTERSSVLAVSNGQNMPIAGLGNGNGLLYPDYPIQSFTYNSITGILTFTTGYVGLQSFTVVVGTGYNETLFEKVGETYIQGKRYRNNFIRYNGAPPQGPPSICQPCVEIPLYTFKVPDAYETTNEYGFTQTISFYSTYDKSKVPIIGTTTIYTPPPLYTITRKDDTTTETDIISRVVAVDVNGNPITYYSTIKYDGHVHTDIISHITTTDKDGKPTVILTQYQSPTPSPGGSGSGSEGGSGSGSEGGSGSNPGGSGSGGSGSGSEGGSGS
ncbi:Hyphally regulated cell wall protein 4, partial [Nakaseomyces glabratus]